MATAAMNPQVRNNSTPVIRKSQAGWVGSKAAKRRDIIKLDASGFIDQAVAVSTQVDTGTLIGIANQAIGSGIAAAAERAMGFTYQIPTGDTILEMKVVNGNDTEVTVAATMIGDKMAIRRTANGHYCADQNSTLHLTCIGVDTVRNVGFFVVQSAKRIVA